MTDQTAPFTPAIDVSQTTVTDMFGQILQQKIQDGVLEQAISMQVDQMINSISENIFRRYGDVHKAIEKQMEAAIIPQLSDIGDLPSYHEMVVNRMRLAAQNFSNERLAAVLDKELKSVFSELPENITLSFLIEHVMREAQDYNDESEGEITLIMDPNRIGGCVMVYLDSNPNMSEHSCSYKLHLSKDRDSENKYSILSLTVDGKKAGENLTIASRLYSADKVLFNVYAMDGLVELDQGTDSFNYTSSWDHYD